MTATAVLTKVNQVYTSARTYSGNIKIVEQIQFKGKTTVTSISHTLKYKAPNQFFRQTEISISGGASAKRSNKMLMSCDGRTIIGYSAEKNMYQKQPVTQPVSLAALLTVVPRGNLPGCVLLPETTVQGHAVYVVQMPKPQMPVLPSKMSAADKAKFASQLAAVHPAKFSIDKSNFTILRMSQQSGANRVTVDLDAQALNGAIPDTAFAFALPRGAKEVPLPAPTQPGMGARPGAMAPPGGPKR